LGTIVSECPSRKAGQGKKKSRGEGSTRKEGILHGVVKEKSNCPAWNFVNHSGKHWARDPGKKNVQEAVGGEKSIFRA